MGKLIVDQNRASQRDFIFKDGFLQKLCDAEVNGRHNFEKLGLCHSDVATFHRHSRMIYQDIFDLGQFVRKVRNVVSICGEDGGEVAFNVIVTDRHAGVERALGRRSCTKHPS